MSGTDDDKLYKKEIEFIKGMLKNYKLDPKQTLISSIVYGNDAKVEFSFSTGQSRQIIKSLLTKMNNPGKGRNLKAALDKVLTSVYTTTNGARENVSKSLVLFVHKDADTSDISGNIDKIKKEEIDLIIVAINRDGKPFTTFVDDPKKLIVLENVDDLTKSIDDVSKATLPGMCAAT